MKILIQLAMMFLFLSHISAQSPQQLAQQELERRGLGDEEVRLRLQERGIDVNDIDINNPSEIFKLEKTLKEVVAEIEKEKLNNSTSNPSSSDGPETNIAKNISKEEAKILAKEGEEISDAIDDGATLEEAVSEELIDAQQTRLPEGVTYGQDLFRSQDIKLYRQSQDVKPPASYVLGVGDVIAVSIWGYSEEDLLFEVNNEGYIKPTGIPRIYLKGIKLGDARKLLMKRFSNYYKFNDNEFEVALNYGRTINVNIVGEVYNFGNFNLPAINTAFNALVAAGGPNNLGSVRNIKLKRYGQPDKNLDVYKYLSDPSYASDLYLEEDDYIYVPVADKLISIRGAVIRPNKYELKKNEDLADLLAYCGGLKANASLKNIQIKRFENDKEILIDVDLNNIVNTNTDFKLRNGDIVRVFAIPDNYKNYVKLGGAVERPGEYAIDNETRISELLSKTKIDKDAYLDVAYLKRRNEDKVTSTYKRINIGSVISDSKHPDNIILKSLDELVIYRQSKFIDAEQFIVSGNVRAPGGFAYDYQNKLNISDAIFLAGGLRKFSTDFGYIRRKNENDPSLKEYLRVNVKSAVEDPSSKENIEILPGDLLVIYSKSKFVESFSVKIEGMVKEPGEYQYDPSLTIKDLLTLSGGLTFNASRKRIDLFRLDVSSDNETKTLAAKIILDENNEVVGTSPELKPFDRIIVRQAADFEEIRMVSIKGEVLYPGTYALLDDNETISSIINRAGGPTKEAFLPGGKLYRGRQGIGFIALDVSEAMKDNSSPQNIAMQEADELVIPKYTDLVTIIGEVKSYEIYNPEISNQGKVVVPFIEGKNAKHYIVNYAGGFQNDADRGNVTVTHPNGRVEKSGRFLFWRTYPEVRKGSRINVFPKKVKVKKEKDGEPINWNVILGNAVTQATAVLTLILLAQRVD